MNKVCVPYNEGQRGKVAKNGVEVDNDVSGGIETLMCDIAPKKKG